MTNERFVDPLPGVPPIESPFFEAHVRLRKWEGETLRVAKQLHELGYAVLEFPEQRLGELADGIVERLEARYAEQRERDRIPEAWAIDSAVRAIAANAGILSLLGELYGRAAIPFQTLNFRSGTQQSCHSDSIHFSSRPERFMCAVWVAFEDTDEDNGPLFYYPGSHRLPIVSNELLGELGSSVEEPYLHHDRFAEAWRRLIECHGLRREEFHARRGQALIWTANLLHGGAMQRDATRTRHSQVTHYFFDDCVYYCPLMSDPFHGRIHFRDVRDIATGRSVPQRIAGRAVPESFIGLAREATSTRPR